MLKLEHSQKKKVDWGEKKKKKSNIFYWFDPFFINDPKGLKYPGSVINICILSPEIF